MDKDKVAFLRRRMYWLNGLCKILEHNHDAIVDHEMYATEFSDFAKRLYSILCELRNIRAAIGDKADELGGES